MKRSDNNTAVHIGMRPTGLALALCAGFLAAAQSPAQQIEELLVTASKTGAVSAQDLNYSIQAFSQDTLEKMGVVEFTDFSRSVPGLDVIDLGPGQKTYIIRGVSGPGESTVGVYIDNIPMVGSGQDALTTGGNQPDLGAFDMTRIEVLRGPQGTLYGSNSVSGVVRYITNKPDPTEFDARIQLDGAIVEHGSPNHSIKGMINIPLVQDEIALRLVGYRNESGGFIDNGVLGKDASCYQRDLANPGKPGTTSPEVTIDSSCLDGTIASGQEDINSYTTQGFRGQLGWNMGERTSLLLQYFHQDVDMDDRTSSNPYDSVYNIGPPFIAGSNVFYTPAVGDLVTNVRSQEPHEDTTEIFALEFEHAFDMANFTLATSWVDRDVLDYRDSSSPARLHKRFYDTPLGPWGGVTLSRDDRVTNTQEQGVEQFTVEARVASELSGPVNFLVGGFYQDLDTSLRSVVEQIDAQSGLVIPNTELLLDRIGGVDQSSRALFGEVYWDVTDQIELMGGVRWFEMERDQTSNLIIPFLKSSVIGGPPGDQPSNPRSYDDVTFKWQVTWRPADEVQFYLNTAEGFRPGGVNAQITPAIPPFFDPDTASSIEAGLKTAWMDDRLYANLGLYHITWQDLQMGAAFTSQFNGMVNCTEQDDPAESKGWEAELIYRVTDRVEVGANYTRMDARWNVDPNTCLPPELVATLSDPIGGFEGQKLVGVPDYSGSAYVDIDFNWSDTVTGFFRGDVVFQGEVDVNQMRVERNIKNPSYAMGNVRLGAAFDNYEVALYVKNVTDEVAYLSMFNTFQQENRVTPSQPRTVGVTLDARF